MMPGKTGPQTGLIRCTVGQVLSIYFPAWAVELAWRRQTGSRTPSLPSALAQIEAFAPPNALAPTNALAQQTNANAQGQASLFSPSPSPPPATVRAEGSAFAPKNSATQHSFAKNRSPEEYAFAQKSSAIRNRPPLLLITTLAQQEIVA